MRSGLLVRWLVAAALVAGVAGEAAAIDVVPPKSTIPVADVRLAPHPTNLPAAAPRDELALLMRNALNRSNKYVLNVWWPKYMDGIEPYQVAGEHARTNSTLDSEEVRRYTSVAYALAVSIATDAYDAGVTGVDDVTAALRVVELVNYVTSTHTANIAGKVGWGGSVQSALWASQVATAGWLAGARLPAPTQVFLGRMLASEADVVTARKIHYLRDRDGRVLTPSNSGAEELAWDGVALWTAVELLPYHPNRAKWAYAAYRRFVGAFARPSDVRSSTVVNGRTKSAWLGGSNAEQSGFVVNHHRINPDYTTDISMWGAPVSALVGNGVPAAMLSGTDVTYRALTSYRFGSPYRAPGGTVYRPGTTKLYYPQGADWGENRQPVYGSLDVQTAVLSPTGTVRGVAGKWALARMRQVRRMQDRFTTGQVYGSEAEDHYRAREEHAAMLIGTAYLTWWLGANSRFTTDNRPYTAKAATVI